MCQIKSITNQYALCVFTLIVSASGMVAMYYLDQDFTGGWFVNAQFFQTLFKLFTASYFFSYVWLIVRTFKKYQSTQVIFNKSNFKIAFLGASLFYPMSL